MQYQKKKIGIRSRRSRAYTIEQWLRNNAEDKPETQRESRREGQSDENDEEDKGGLHPHSVSYQIQELHLYVWNKNNN